MNTIAHPTDYHQTHQNYWEVKPWQPVLAGLSVIAVPIIFLILLIGGIFFWMPRFDSLSRFNASSSGGNDVEVAQAGLGTMKKMVGDKAVWSAAIKQEYDRLYPSDTSGGQAAATSCNSFSSNVINP